MLDRRRAYKASETLHRTTRVVVQRAQRIADGLPVVLKSMLSGGNERDIERLSREYALLVMLAERIDVTGIIKPLELSGPRENLMLVVHDTGGLSVDRLLPSAGFDSATLFQLALQGTQILARVHAAGVLHNDITPTNMVLNQSTQRVELIDFGIAYSFAGGPFAATPGLVEGTLSYLSPERTGRVNQPVDNRSDLYAWGATLYELALGKALLAGAGRADLIQAILTYSPPAPHTVNPAVNPLLSRVIMKLVAKAPDERYQSAVGLLADIERCDASAPESFTLGSADRSESFDLPAKLYGRQSACAQLDASLRQTLRLNRHLTMIGGPSGVGKSALVGTLRASLADCKGNFGAGKHDLLHRHLPFSALAHALGQVAQSLSAEPEAAWDRWKRLLQAAVGSIGQALVEMIPSFEPFIGKQRPTPTLAAAENENRLQFLLKRVLQALGTERPLILFLDDLQWADHGTLRFIQEFVQDKSEGASILLIGAFRNDEVAADHPLHALLHKLSGADNISNIVLEPLDLAATSDMIGDATGANPDLAGKIARLVHAKTNGNPFFVREFLLSLRARNF